MRTVFFGSPDFAVATLRALLDAGREVVAVVTQPDRPAGRGHALLPPPVKVLAQEYGLPVLQPGRVSDPEPVEELRAFKPDVFIVAAYGQILRQRVLDLPSRGTLNVHASLLPRHRGASPIAAAILAGDGQTGVTIMEMVRALDAGPMVARVELPISPFDTTGSLEPRLAKAGAQLLIETLDGWYEGDADLHGAPSVVVKSAGRDIPESAIEEACAFAVGMSKAWGAGHAAGEAYWVLPSQVSKTPNPGEYVARGAFIVRGKRNYRTVSVRLAVGEVFLDPRVGEDAPGRRPGAIEVEGARKMMGGPDRAVAGQAKRYVVLEPGDEAANALAPRLAKAFGVPTEEIQAVLPPGGSRVVEVHGVELP